MIQSKCHKNMQIYIWHWTHIQSVDKGVIRIGQTFTVKVSITACNPRKWKVCCQQPGTQIRIEYCSHLKNMCNVYISGDETLISVLKHRYLDCQSKTHCLFRILILESYIILLWLIHHNQILIKNKTCHTVETIRQSNQKILERG